MKVACPTCNVLLTLTLPECASKQHLLVHCLQCEEVFIQHHDFQKSMHLDKEKIGEFIDSADMQGMRTYLVSLTQQMEAEVISKSDIDRLKLTLDVGGDVSNIVGKL